MQITRRQFLKYGVIAGGTFPIVAGLQRRHPSTSIAIVGLGDAGVRHLNSISSIEGLEISGIADPLKDRRETAMKRLRAAGRDVPSAESDGSVLIQKVRPDIVVIATPDGQHLDQCRLALGRGCHVMVESLPVASVEAWTALASAFRRQSRLLQVAVPWRMDPQFQAFEAQVARQRHDWASRVSIACSVPFRKNTASRSDDTGPVSDALFPLLDALTRVPAARELQSCFATGSALTSSSRLDAPRTMIAAIRTYAGMDISLRYADVAASGSSAPSSILSIGEGEKGATCRIEYRPQHHLLTSFWTDWLACLRGKSPQASPPESFTHAIHLASGLLQAYTSGRTVHFAREPSLQSV